MVHSTMMFKNMGKQFSPLLIGLGLLLFVSCQDTLSVDPQEDFIVFGQFNGYCLGDACFIFYALTEDVLLESNVDKYSGSGFYPYDDYAPLSQDKFNIAEDLGAFVPQELWLETTSHIGQADVSDVGALYFEMKNGSDHRYWVFERGDFDMPVVYKTFMSKIQEKITLINQ
ncbi:MAG: hypothetical protein IPN60_04000 [Saprospiraceae bacterium]|nr:hypothetical protein [Candidatus Opimibacter skivensis]